MANNPYLMVRSRSEYYTNPTSWLTQRQTEKKSFHQIRVTLRNIYKKQHGARPCVEKMQLIFFVPPNEELEGTLHPQSKVVHHAVFCKYYAE
jgi:hypothetical protein